MKSGLSATEKTCANCLEPLGVPVESSGRALAVAWMNACAICVASISDQMQVIEDRPGGQRIQILRCTWCGEQRACRPGWRTRCHLCLDDRTSSVHIEGIEAVRQALVDQGSMDDLRTYRGLDPGEDIDDWTLHEAIGYDLLGGTLASYARAGWTVLATDIHGLPWDWREASTRNSHGTWGRHDACGSIQKMERGRTECPICPPEDGSRTFRAKKDDPHLLYLVRSGRWQKFGHGNWPRVRAHRSEIVQVLRGRHEDVVNAESVLKTRHRNQPHPAPGSAPRTFGAGGEVVPATLPIDLADVLPVGEDITVWFANP